MTKIKTNLYGKNVDMKLSEGNLIAPKLQLDADLQVKAAGDALLAQTGALNTKNMDNTSKHDAAKAATAALQISETSWNDVLKAAVAKVTEIYPNNSVKWIELSFETVSAAAVTGVPPQISGLSVTHGDFTGENDLHWNSIKSSSAYKIQECNLDPSVEANWKAATPDVCTKSKTTVMVNPALTTWFRVLAVGAGGQGPYSNPAKVSA